MALEQPSFFERLWDRLLELDDITKRVLYVFLDCILITSCYILSMALRLDGFDFIHFPKIWNVLYIVLPATVYLFIRMGLYRAVLRFISARAFKVIISGAVISATTMFIADQLLVLPVPRSVPFIYLVLLSCMIGGTRFGLRALYRIRVKHSKDAVVIYGAGESGRQLLDAIQFDRDFSVVAFVDDNSKLHGREISSIDVYSPADLGMLKQKLGVKFVLLAMPSASRVQRKEIITRVENLTLQLRTIPSIGDLVSGRAQVNDLKFVDIDELLGRDIVPPDPNLLRVQIFEKIVLVTGAGGSIGSELCRQIVKQKPKIIILFDVSEFALYLIHNELEEKSISTEVTIIPILGSIQNKKLLEKVFCSFDVDTVYHAAAYKHVPLVEQNIAEAVHNNVFGTLTLVNCAISAQINAFIFISSDKAVRPTNFMGASKRIAELICQSYARRQSHTCISMVRFGNVLGSSGSVIPRFKEQIRTGGPVTVTHPKVTRFFMTISEASELVIQSGAMAKGGDVFVLNMGKPIEIVELARKIIRLHGLEPYYESSNPEVANNGDICIKFTGLRPGEKLYEELLIQGNPVDTAHPRIMCADEIFLDENELDQYLDKLLDACLVFDIEQIEKILVSMPLYFKPDKILSGSLLFNSALMSTRGIKTGTYQTPE